MDVVVIALIALAIGLGVGFMLGATRRAQRDNRLTADEAAEARGKGEFGRYMASKRGDTH